MIHLKKIGVGIAALVLAVGASILSQVYSSTYAANTLAGVNEIITINTSDGLPINAGASPLGYSGDGNVVLFYSTATNLPNAGGSGGLYTYNIKTNTTARVDISTSGVVPNGGLAGSSLISETGRYVTFASLATNLIDGSTESQRIIYKRDTKTNVTSKIGAGYTGGDSTKWDRNLAISNDGRFSLVSSRYLANGYPNDYGIVVGDGVSGAYNWTSIGQSAGNGYNDATAGGISCDGAFAVYKKQYDILLVDLRKGSATTSYIANATSTSPMISCNGRYVLYATKNRTDITPTPSGMDTYLHLVRYDRITGERMYIDSNSSNVFSTSHLNYSPTYYDQQPNVFEASIADSGDVVFRYNGNTYLKHLSDGSGTLESIGKTATGVYVNITSGAMTSDGRYVFFQTDPYNLGLAPSPSSAQLIRAKTNL